jgi:O-methyltransferase
MRTCRRAVPAHGRPLLVEQLLDEGPDPRRTAFSDLNMLVATGGQERTVDQYRSLLTAASFRLNNGRSALDFSAFSSSVCSGELETEILSKQQITKGPAQMFTGDVWFDVIVRGATPSGRRSTSSKAVGWCSLAGVRWSKCDRAMWSGPRPASSTGTARPQGTS